MDPHAKDSQSIAEWQRNTSGELDVIAWFLGPLFDILLYGVVFTLVFNYTRDAWGASFLSSLSLSSSSTRPHAVTVVSNGKGHGWPWSTAVRSQLRHHSWIGTAVFAVFILSTLKTACSFYIVIRIGAIETALYFLRVLNAQPVVLMPFLTSLTALSVQLYYIVRLNALLSVRSGRFFSKIGFRWTLITLVLALSLTSSALSVVSIQSLIVDDSRLFSPFLVGCLIAAFLSDAIITTFTILAMLQVGNGSKVNQSRRSLVGRIARFTALSAAIPAVLSLFQVALVMTPQRYSRWHMTINFILAKTYDLSLLWTIAYRKRMIERPNEHHHQQQQHSRQREKQPTLELVPAHSFQFVLDKKKKVSLSDGNSNGKARAEEKELDWLDQSMFAHTLPHPRFSTITIGVSVGVGDLSSQNRAS